MKQFLFLGAMILCSIVVNAQFNSRKDVIEYLCSRSFYDVEKEYKVVFKTKEVEYAGSITKQLQVFANDERLGTVNQSEVKLNPYDGREGQLHYFGNGMKVYFDVYFNGPATTNSQVRGKLICQEFFGLPVDVLIPEGTNK